MKKKYIYLIFTISCTISLLFFTISNSTDAVKKPVGKHAPLKPDLYIPTPQDKHFLEEFSAYIADVFEKTNTPGACVTIVKNNAVLFQEAYGVKSAGGSDSVNTETLFRLASVSKGFSSILAGLMVRDSLIQWDDLMADYISYPLLDEAKNITIRHLLSHTAGFSYQAYSTLVEDELPRDTMIKRLLKLPLSRTPGDIHSYQNVAYSIIEPILESATQKPFRQLVYERIFNPLNMENASICYDSMINAENVASPHGYAGYRKYAPVRIDRSYYNVAAAGGINASIADMTKWLKAILGNNKDIIPPSVVDQVFDPVIRIRVRSPFNRVETPRKGYYGLGWRIIEYPSDTLVYHGGYANGYKSGIAVDRNKKIGICVLTNAPSRFSSLVLSNFFQVYKEHFEEAPAEALPVEDMEL